MCHTYKQEAASKHSGSSTLTYIHTFTRDQTTPNGSTLLVTAETNFEARMDGREQTTTRAHTLTITLRHKQTCTQAIFLGYVNARMQAISVGYVNAQTHIPAISVRPIHRS